MIARSLAAAATIRAPAKLRTVTSSCLPATSSHGLIVNVRESKRNTVVLARKNNSRVSSTRPFAATAASGEGTGSEMRALVLKKNADNPVTVWSKSWCPFCNQVKAMFDKLGVPYLAMELDNFHEEADILTALVELTEQRTVPNIFIGGQYVGGCDTAMDLNRSGELTKMLEAAGVEFKKE
eukprot:CAMPEP_0181365662 /NCGR_PEP_ID=MMETSP1106-20121128/10212_1 /TAXON_ID=81844 /ORGANISM="Mantoniella antarctica, Strain SL-175" /LENGTH=180 /DNA_ID=CAMNT_0023480803 /DNA_START=41 /DNA_END=583 /DNA_ORIENTATION=+